MKRCSSVDQSLKVGDQRFAVVPRGGIDMTVFICFSKYYSLYDLIIHLYIMVTSISTMNN